VSEKRPLSLTFPRGETLPVWTFLFAALITLFMGVSSLIMMATALNMSIDGFGIVFFLSAFSLSYSYFHTLKDYRITLIVAGVNLLIIGLFAGFDLFATREGIADLLSALAAGSGSSVENIFSMTAVLALLGMFPAFLTSWVVVRGKNILLALLGYTPFLAVIIAMSFHDPSSGATIVFVGGVVMLFIFKNVRKSAKETTYRNLLILFAPVLVLLCVANFLYPQKNYSKDKLAKEKYKTVQQYVEKVRDALGSFGVGNLAEYKKIKNVARTYSGSVLIDNLTETMSLSIGTENLMTAGNFTPPKVKFMSLMREKNGEYKGPVSEGNRYVYLKTSSMANYEGHFWRADAPHYAFRDYYPNGNIDEKEAEYTIRLNIDLRDEYSFVPYYVDHYRAASGSPDAPAVKVMESYNVNEKVLFETPIQEYAFAYNTVPVKYEEKWSDSYLAYVYGDCLYVPESTNAGIMDTAMLPGWYMDLLRGNKVWSTDQIVEKVIEFVSGLHPYDENTGFAPNNIEDFVCWFMTDCETGFCVHYASTAVVLLRMVGVPARYVSGYFLTDVKDGEMRDVYVTDAHSWIEYFHPEYGWIMDDPTPGNQEAASYYNAKAIVAEYGPMTAKVTPAPARTTNPSSSSSSGNAGEFQREREVPQQTNKSGLGSFMQDTLRRIWHLFLMAVILLGVIAVLVFIFRLGFQIYWKRKFKDPDTNKKARAYFRYYDTIAMILKGDPSKDGTHIAEKAAFSRKGISQEEFEALIEKEEKNLDGLYKKAKTIRKDIYEILVIRKKLPI